VLCNDISFASSRVSASALFTVTLDRAPCTVQDIGGQAKLIMSTGTSALNWQCVTYLLMAGTPRLLSAHSISKIRRRVGKRESVPTLFPWKTRTCFL